MGTEKRGKKRGKRKKRKKEKKKKRKREAIFREKTEPIKNGLVKVLNGDHVIDIGDFLLFSAKVITE